MQFTSKDKPKIKSTTLKREGFNGWLKCSDCGELLHKDELKKNLSCCHSCNHHFRITAKERIDLLTDPGTFEELFGNIQPTDSLEFTDSKPYAERLEESKENEAILTGIGKLNGKPLTIGAMEFGFMGGSMGSVVGERITLLAEYSLHTGMPLVLVSASGGARMQESIYSLMQMAKTAGALAKLHEAKIPFISILTNPTSGGVTASFASLGDLILAEPGALICFAGPRVIEQTIGQKIPEGAQKAEFLLQHGFIDCIVKRHGMKDLLSKLLQYVNTQNKRL